jgi:hypothetical protein
MEGGKNFARRVRVERKAVSSCPRVVQGQCCAEKRKRAGTGGRKPGRSERSRWGAGGIRSVLPELFGGFRRHQNSDEVPRCGF